MSFSNFRFISFDCYGTLINWEKGILDVLEHSFSKSSSADPQDLLTAFAELESESEAAPFKNYHAVLTDVYEGLCKRFDITDPDTTRLAESVVEWDPFNDSSDALKKLQTQFELVILSNVDRAMFQQTQNKLDVDFDFVFTAEEIGSYKPARQNFEFMLNKLDCQPDQILHVAQSLFHDHVPAKEFGLTTIWVNRPSLLKGQGATLPAHANPDFEVGSMAELVDLIFSRSEASTGKA